LVGSVGALVNGQGAFAEWAGVGGLAEVAKDLGDVVQADGDFGVVGSVDGLVNGQGAFGEWAGVAGLAEVAKDLDGHGSASKWQPGRTATQYRSRLRLALALGQGLRDRRR
jgi:hypothetical protein